MAEFAAVGIAASILQVIGFGTRLIATAWQLSKSEHTFLTGLEDLRKTSKNFRDAQRTLQSTAPGPNMAIDSLVQKSVAISEEMMNSLDKFGRGRSVLKKAWLALWKEEKLKALEVSLREVQLDLTFHMTVDLRSVVRDSAEKQDQILRELRKPGLNSKDKTEGSVDSALGYGASIVEYLTDGLPLHDKIKSELIGDLVANIYSLEGEYSTLSDASSIQLSGERRTKLEQLFISRLCYDTIQNQDGNNGSTAGSMSPESALLPRGRCEKHFKQWAGNDDKLTIVSFHFWAVGSKLQRSQEGLLRTLLVQLLRAHPEVIPVVAPLRWESPCLFNLDPKTFNQIELGNMFQQAIVYISTRAKLAMFIDGLDEFDGNCYDLVSLVQRCVESSIKICVSSRPWVEFEGAFGDCPRLKMEDLTHQDISDYVFAKFEADTQFKGLQRRQARVAKDLVEAIVKKSSGVFLWVTIVVASLLAGIGAGDRVEDLQKRLGLLPAEIKNLYERILENIDSGYREHTAQLLKLMAAFKTQPSPLLFWYADEVNFMDRAIKEDPIDVSRSESLERVEDIRRRLNSRCKGLLEIHKNTTTADQFSSRFGGTVDYLHKTVYEFVCSRRTQHRLRKYLNNPYDANLRIAAAYAAVVKGAANRVDGTRERDTHRGDLASRLIACLDHASSVSLDSNKQVVRLLDHLTYVGPAMPHDIWHSVIATRPSINHKPPTDSWAKELTYLERVSRLKYSDKMLCLATSMSVVAYVRARAKPGGYVVTQATTVGRPQNGLAQLAERMINKLFGHGRVSLLSLVCFSTQTAHRYLNTC
ncbi:vegetative incompatibility protein het-e-1 [Fusarium langsethiae]|uniref:Vegetative incompatibility protein het-e-1 n=1 Tax=Fusarium langsethiae TaxID=179993 RepID=A0A0M9EUI9_FUSLA|nr:vegetative incompatibility protein het-e-1 [Fusarium langsethiae]GKU04372.1 unnamed protein product [Fusarium langsethiae]